MKGFLKLTALVLILFLVSCASTVRKPLKTPFLKELAAWPVVYQQNFNKILSFIGKAKVTIESKQFSGRVRLQTYWVRPDTLFLKAEGPLGIDLGQIFMGRERFIVYNQMANQYIAGNLTETYLARFLDTDFQLIQLREAFLGRAPFPSTGIRLTDSKKGIFQGEDEKYQYRYKINPMTGLIDDVLFLQNGKPVLKEEFKNYTRISGIYVPRVINLILIDKNERLSIFYDSINLNKKIDSDIFTIKIGPKVKQLNLN